MHFFDSSPVESWMWVYSLNILLGGMMAFASIVLDSRRCYGNGVFYMMPTWAVLLTGVGFMSIFFFPFNVAIFAIIHVVMHSMGAPISAVIISMVFTLVVWLASLRFQFGHVPVRAT